MHKDVQVPREAGCRGRSATTILTGFRPRTTGDFRFGESHQSHFAPAPSPAKDGEFPHALFVSVGPPKGYPYPCGGRARSLSHPFGPSFVSLRRSARRKAHFYDE